MFDNYVWSDEKIINKKTVKGKEGFSLKTLITYYRGIPLSMIEDFKVSVDGVEIDREKLLFCPNGEDWFTLNEMTTMPSYKWEYGVEGEVFAEYEGGLTPGEHQVRLFQSIRTAYIPVPFGGEKTTVVSVE